MKQGARYLALAVLTSATVFVAGCKKKEAPAPAKETAAPEAAKSVDLAAAFGPGILVPADYEWICAYTDLGKGWAELKGTKLVSGALEMAAEAMAKKSAEGEDGAAAPAGDFPKWQDIVADLGSDHFFIAGAKGSSVAIRRLGDLANDARFAQIKAAIANQTAPGSAAGPAELIPLVVELPFPPMVMGFKVAADGPALKAMKTWEAALPASVQKSATKVEGGPEFQLWKTTVGELFPAHQIDTLKVMLEGNGTSSEEAEAAITKLKARTLQLAWGMHEGRLIISIGEDQTHLKFAASPAQSIVAAEPLKQVLPYAGKRMFGYGYVAAEPAKTLLSQPTITSYYDKLAPALGPLIPEAEAAGIRSGIEAADKEFAPAWPRKIDPLVNALWLDGGIHGEQFGGVLPGYVTTSTSRRLAPPADATLWFNWNADPKGVAAMYAGTAKLAATLYDAFWKIAPQMAPAEQITQARQIDALAVPKIKTLFGIFSDLFQQALGPEAAFAVEFKGEVPPLPNKPPELEGKNIAPRIAYIGEIAKREMLTDLWKRTMQLAAEIAVFTPMAQQFAGGIPEPQSVPVEGGKMYFYPIPAPMPLGEHTPNLTILDSGFEIFSTSSEYTNKLAALLKTPQKAATPAFTEVKVVLDPIWEPLQFIFTSGPSSSPEETEQITKAFGIMGNFHSFEYRGYEENGAARRSMTFKFD